MTTNPDSLTLVQFLASYQSSLTPRPISKRQLQIVLRRWHAAGVLGKVATYAGPARPTLVHKPDELVKLLLNRRNRGTPQGRRKTRKKN